MGVRCWRRREPLLPHCSLQNVRGCYFSRTAKDGEISVLDPGGYGAVTITKWIYINGTHGAGYGSILNVLVNGVIINITDAADVRKAVRLRALDINGASQGINGISILSASNVWVEDCSDRRQHRRWNHQRDGYPSGFRCEL